MSDEEKIAKIAEAIRDYQTEGDILPSVCLVQILEIGKLETCHEGNHPFGLHVHGGIYDGTTVRRLV